MADEMFTVHIEGLAELKAQLEEFETKTKEKIIRKALKAGADIERAAIAERAPVKVGSGGILPDGALKNDIVVKMSRDENNSIIAIVGPDSYTRRVAGWVEFGHRKVTGGYSRVLPDGKTRGPGTAAAEDVPEHPFIRPAFEATQQEVAETICNTLVTETEAALARKGTT